MKKLFALLTAMFITVAVIAQERKISEIPVNQLPKGVSSYINEMLPGSKIIQAAKVVENSGTSYIAMVNVNGKNHAYQFDSNGKFKGKPDPGLIKEAKLKMADQQTKTKADPNAKPPVNTDPPQPAKQGAKPVSDPTKATTTPEPKPPVKPAPTTTQTGKAQPTSQPVKTEAKPATKPPAKSDAETVPAKSAASEEVPKK